MIQGLDAWRRNLIHLYWYRQVNQNQGQSITDRETRYDPYSNNHEFLPLPRDCNDKKRNCTIVAPIFVDHEDPLIDSYPEVNSCNLTPFHM